MGTPFENGSGDMVVMSIETFEKSMFMSDIYQKLEEAKEDMKLGHYSTVESAVERIKEKNGL